VGNCCSNVLRSLRAYGVSGKAARTYVCEKNDTAHVHSSRCAIPYIHMHTCMPTYQIQTRVHDLHSSAQRNSIYYAQTSPHYYVLAMYCTHSSIWSVELRASTAAMCCAPSVPMEFPPRLYAHMCVRRARQRTCIAHDAQSHTHNRVRGHIHPYIRACRHTKYEHMCMPCTYTYLHSSAQRNSIHHTQTCPTTTHSYEQAM
jgi:hypothetical protein